MTKLSIIIASFNTQELLKNCLESIWKEISGVDYEVIVVDNASSDGSVEYIKNQILKFKNTKQKLKIIENRENFGFAKANNQGIKIAQGKYILLLNSDTKLHENSLSKVISYMDDHKDIGALTCKLINADGSVQANGGKFPNLIYTFLWGTFIDDLPFVQNVIGAYHLHPKTMFLDDGVYNYTHEQDWISGAFFLLRKEVINEVGDLNEDIFMYGEDVEYCYRIKKHGWKIWYSPVTTVTHFGSSSGKGKAVQFLGSSMGKEGGVLGEFKGLTEFYKKYYPAWNYPLLLLILKLSALLRIIVFGIFGRQKEAIIIYAKALAIY